MIRHRRGFEGAVLDTLAARLGVDPVELRRPFPLSPAAKAAADRIRLEWARQAAERRGFAAQIVARVT